MAARTTGTAASGPTPTEWARSSPSLNSRDAFHELWRKFPGGIDHLPVFVPPDADGQTIDLLPFLRALQEHGICPFDLVEAFAVDRNGFAFCHTDDHFGRGVATVQKNIGHNWTGKE